MVGDVEDRIWLKDARGMDFCHNQMVEMAVRLDGEAVECDEECQAVFAEGCDEECQAVFAEGCDEECQAVFAEGKVVQVLVTWAQRQVLRATAVDPEDGMWERYPEFQMLLRAQGCWGGGKNGRRYFKNSGRYSQDSFGHGCRWGILFGWIKQLCGK
jgi:hypothetical protein